MTNIDRAAEHLDSLDRLYDYASGKKPSNAERAQALADNGYLMPDMPAVQFAQDGTPYWEADGEVYQPAQLTGFIDGMDAYGEPFRERVEDIKEKALAMLAAAAYTERNHHEHE